jgi:hypothetical protein
MRTNRGRVVLVAAGACFAFTSMTFAGYLAGSAGLIQQQSGPMYSAGVAEWYNNDGSRSFSVTIAGQHYISDVATGTVIASKSYTVTQGEYNSFVNGTGDSGHCYTGHLTAAAYPYGYLLSPVRQQWESIRVCARGGSGGGGGGGGCDPTLDPTCCEEVGDCGGGGGGGGDGCEIDCPPEDYAAQKPAVAKTKPH